MTRPVTSAIAACLVLLSCVGPAAAQDAPSERVITAARLRGIEFLKSKQLTDGSWEFTGHPVGITALCTLALLENGLPINDPAIEKGHRFVKRNIDDVTQTYDCTLAILLLSRIDEIGNKSEIRTLAARLVAGQVSSGGWTYSNPKASALILVNPDEKPDQRVSPGDNSNTQFAVLGLWTASRSGVNIEDVMEQVSDRFVESQNTDGGWGYRHPSDGEVEPSRNTMTFAALFCLTVSRATKIRAEQEEASDTDETRVKVNEGDLLKNDPVYAKGLEKATQYAKGGVGTRYYAWSMERLGVLLGLEEFGDVNWFNKGADALLKSQKEDGSWEDSRGPFHETSFALLFLRKANLGSDISRLLAGDPDEAFTIHGRDPAPRFKTLTEAFDAAKAGETIRIEGDGPFKMPHLVFEKDLNIEAAPGYTPVVEYGVGVDSIGLRIDPGRNADARMMAHVKSGTVTLEGLKFEMDAPEVGRTVPWSAIKVSGGHLRMLNCSISEGKRKDIACIEVVGPSEVTLRNCLIGGGRAAVEISTGGETKLNVVNSILFSNDGVSIVRNKEDKRPAAIELHFDHATIQAKNAVAAPSVTGKIDVTSRGSAYKADVLGSWLLPQKNSPKDRSWSGADNYYDVREWLMNTKISGDAAWSRFWSGKDEKPKTAQVTFTSRRPVGASSHRIKSADWEFAERTDMHPYRNRIGARTVIVGAGRPFSRFRESISYNQWQKGDEGLAQLDAPATE